LPGKFVKEIQERVKVSPLSHGLLERCDRWFESFIVSVEMALDGIKLDTAME